MNVYHLLLCITGLYLTSRQLTKIGVFYKLNPIQKKFSLNLQFWHSKKKNLKDIIGSNKVFDNKKFLNVQKFNKGKCQPCFTRSINFCCKKLKTCLTFQSTFNKNTFLIRHVTCKSSCVIYLMESAHPLSLKKIFP